MTCSALLLASYICLLCRSNEPSSLPQNILSDERLCQSEALYAFLSPSPDYLKVIDVQGKKNTFSLSSFLERLPRDFFSHQEVRHLKAVFYSIF